MLLHNIETIARDTHTETGNYNTARIRVFIYIYFLTNFNV